MFVYAIATIPLILRTVEHLEGESTSTKSAAYADDIFGAGKIEGLRKMWDFIEREGPKYGYYQQAEKTWLIVKQKDLKKARQIFADTKVKITVEGKKHLGAAIGSEKYREEFIAQKIDTWINELKILSEIALTAPQEAYTCFTAGYKHKFSYYMRTIPNLGIAMRRIDETITMNLIPAITGGIIPTQHERRLFSLPPSLGGLGIPIFEKQTVIEFENSQQLTVSPGGY